ncbi:MAG: YlxR family protein [Anaerolineales bacterium]|nr:YlxR family protein [Anaerolineales bacterium]MCB8951029.1 YlxR family protein [Ardenticatenales bacterium]
MPAKTQPRRKHVPQRTCIACGQKSDKRRLTRLVRVPDEGVVVDPTGKRNGRGAYLCDRPACWEKALSSAILNRALGGELTTAEKQSIAAHKPVTVDREQSQTGNDEHHVMTR